MAYNSIATFSLPRFLSEEVLSNDLRAFWIHYDQEEINEIYLRVFHFPLVSQKTSLKIQGGFSSQFTTRLPRFIWEKLVAHVIMGWAKFGTDAIVSKV